MIPRTILAVHNYYKFPGGEDEVFNSEAALLEHHGHRVIRYEEYNTRISRGAIAGVAAIWNHRSYNRIRDAIREHRPDVIHFHNTFPLISPAAHYAARSLGVPVVQQLSNFRLLCPGAYLLREGTVCEDCLASRSFLPAIRHACYRGSRPATGAVCAMLSAHRAFRTWQNMVDAYVATTEFARRKFVEGGLPAERIMVKRHFVGDSSVGNGRGRFALFVGRLSPEKGIHTLAKAWQSLPDVPLIVAGDGPLRNLEWPRSVECIGQQSSERVRLLMKEATVLIVPSLWYEIGPLTVLEAYASGLPVIASNLGSMAERIEHLRTGLLFAAGDPDDLARQVRWLFTNPDCAPAMRAAVRQEYEDLYSAEANYKALIRIYSFAIETAVKRRERRPLPGAPGPQKHNVQEQSLEP